MFLYSKGHTHNGVYVHSSTHYTLVSLQVFGSKVRVDSTQKIAELELAEKVNFLCSYLCDVCGVVCVGEDERESEYDTSTQHQCLH